MKRILLQQLLLFSITISPVFSYSQNDLWDKLDDATELVKSTTKLFNSVDHFLKATNRTTQEFNKSVNVVTGKNINTVDSSKQTKTKNLKYKKGEFTNLYWEPIAYFDDQLFPSMIISMANYKGVIGDQMMKSIKSSALGFRLYNRNANLLINWEIECVDKTYFDKVSGKFQFSNNTQETYIMPDIPWNYTALAKQNTSIPINVIFRVFDTEGNKVEVTKPLFLRSINDCIFKYRDVELDFLFTAFIQEQHPEIDKILREALNTKMITSIHGYQGDDSSTIMQVAAIWRVLHDRGFQYSSVTTTPGAGSNIWSQSVRTFSNSLKTNQANCVDGTVVFASILRAMGISAKLILTHNHCFLGFYTNRAKSNLVFLETTMLSHSDIIEKETNPKKKSKAYYSQFKKAIDVAHKEYQDYMAQNDIVEIDVDLYRNYVQPLPYE